jgi:hypothetical protein
MDEFRAFDDDADAAGGDVAAIEAPPEIGTDERRMHVRAYNYWVSLLDGRPYPSIADLEPANLDDFGPHSVLLDFTRSTDDPVVSFLGRELREACGLTGDVRTVADVPSRSLLSRLTDHYLQIIANCAPIGFEAEFDGQNGANTMYRGILMPLSSDGDSIDFIYGVINWKEVADGDTAASIVRQADRLLKAPVPASPVWADGPRAEPLDAPVAPAAEEDEDQLDFELGPDAGLADRLCLARDCAGALQGIEARSRTALYRTLGLAYDFALAADDNEEDYAELLEDAGLKAQARAPMTPVVKLVFGADYDKGRLTEYAAALSHGRRLGIEASAFADFLESFAGGLKGVVAAERAAKRPEPRADRREAGRAALRQAPVLAVVDVEAQGDEFVLLLARRQADGRLAIVAPVAEDDRLIDQAIRKSDA